MGLINRHTSAADIAEHAVEDARALCDRAHGDAPDVVIIGRKDLNFTYIPSHLYYCLFELLKNSLRAVVESHGAFNALPPIKARRDIAEMPTRCRRDIAEMPTRCRRDIAKLCTQVIIN